MTRATWGRVLRWLPLAVVAGEVVLLVSGVLDPAAAATAIVLVEVALAGIVIGEAAALRAGYRRARRAGAGRSAAVSGALDAALPPAVAGLLRMESRVFVALARWLRRRPRVGPGDIAVPYAAGLKPLLLVLSGVSLAELAAVELLVPWPGVRWALLILGGYGLLWMLGCAASLSVGPHLLGRRELRLRCGLLADIAVPVELLVAARRDVDATHRRTVEYADGTLSVSVLGSTNVHVELARPYPVELGRRGVRPVRAVRFHADDPDAAVRALRAAIDAGNPVAGQEPGRSAPPAGPSVAAGAPDRSG